MSQQMKLRPKASVLDVPVLECTGSSPSGQYYEIEIVGPRALKWSRIMRFTNRRKGFRAELGDPRP